MEVRLWNTIGNQRGCGGIMISAKHCTRVTWRTASINKLYGVVGSGEHANDKTACH